MSIPPSRGRPTIVDVAREAGVSVATVSNALNNRRYVEAKTKLRIDATVARLGYTPNVYARRMRTTGIGTIGLFSSMPFAISANTSRLGFLMDIAATAAVSALECGFALLLLPSIGNALPRLEELAIDGAIVIEPSIDDPYLAQLRGRGIPLVTIGRQPGAPPASAAVDLRSSETLQLLMDHLDAMSSRRIALMTGTARRNSYVESEDTYSALAATRGMDPLIVRVDEGEGEAGAYAATLRLLQEHPQLDGLLAMVDTFASGALRALKDRAVVVPDAFRVVTRYDGHRARESTPPLTAVDLHLETVAANAVALLVEQLQSSTAGRVVLAPLPALIPRASSALSGDRRSRSR